MNNHVINKYKARHSVVISHNGYHHKIDKRNSLGFRLVEVRISIMTAIFTKIS